MAERFSVNRAVHDPGGVWDCRRRGCHGMYFHAYDDSGDNVLGLVCSSCGELRHLREPLALVVAETYREDEGQ